MLNPKSFFHASSYLKNGAGVSVFVMAMNVTRRICVMNVIIMV